MRLYVFYATLFFFLLLIILSLRHFTIREAFSAILSAALRAHFGKRQVGGVNLILRLLGVGCAAECTAELFFDTLRALFAESFQGGDGFVKFVERVECGRVFLDVGANHIGNALDFLRTLAVAEEIREQLLIILMVLLEVGFIGNNRVPQRSFLLGRSRQG